MSSEVMHPTTGELVPVTEADDEFLLFVLNQAIDNEREWADRRRIIEREFVSRMDLSAEWTRHVGPWKLTAASPSPTEEWDGETLHKTLATFVDLGTVSTGAADAAVEKVDAYKVKKAGINALRKRGGAIKDTIDGLSTERPKGDRRVRIERSVP